MIGVVVFPGTNCEFDVVEAVRSVGGEATTLWHGDR
jgi:phosphoribosylformylglycinamidine (FGAM) synthase-like amidotransferase family enzyme